MLGRVYWNKATSEDVAQKIEIYSFVGSAENQVNLVRVWGEHGGKTHSPREIGFPTHPLPLQKVERQRSRD